jgi:hypothetical protein
MTKEKTELTQQVLYLMLLSYYQNKVVLIQSNLNENNKRQLVEYQTNIKLLNADKGEKIWILYRDFISKVMTEDEHTKTTELYQQFQRNEKDEDKFQKCYEYIGQNFNWYKNK